MLLSKIVIKNYRLLLNADLNIDEKMTLIVGRNNTAKTSCMDLIEKVLKNGGPAYDDYPLSKRKYASILLAQFIRRKISFERFCEKLPITSIEFVINYSLDDPEKNLGALSPFIIDVDDETNTARIRADYKVKIDADTMRKVFEPCFYVEGVFKFNSDELRDACVLNFSKIFELKIYAINPKNEEDIQIKQPKELAELFPYYLVPAERVLGETGGQSSNSLSSLIANYFSVDIDKIDPKISEEVERLRHIVETANKAVQKQSNDLLSSIVNKAIGFGYPNAEELQLGVHTRLQIDNEIKDRTELTYISGLQGESLPSTHNGLGYKNLIKIEFLLADFAEKINQGSTACIPLLFIEEPESHMHPQMQQIFASYLESFLSNISEVHIQTFLTTHSAHIANTIDFSKIRYAQKTSKGVVFKDLNTFCMSDDSNMDFIKKYLTLSRCDLFFADKIVLVEGASERLLLPDIIRKCDETNLFSSQKYKLTSQYYTLIEIGGAFAHKFIPFISFLGIPCLILTDIDAINAEGKTTFVSNGKASSNSTLKWWVQSLGDIPEEGKNDLERIIGLTDEKRTLSKCHVEFQSEENGLCGRSLEEAIRNVNRAYYNLSVSATEEELKFTGKSKTDFALDLICNKPDYLIPKYIAKGLVWLNNQTVLV